MNYKIWCFALFHIQWYLVVSSFCCFLLLYSRLFRTHFHLSNRPSFPLRRVSPHLLLSHRKSLSRKTRVYLIINVQNSGSTCICLLQLTMFQWSNLFVLVGKSTCQQTCRLEIVPLSFGRRPSPIRYKVASCSRYSVTMYIYLLLGCMNVTYKLYIC